MKILKSIQKYRQNDCIFGINQVKSIETLILLGYIDETNDIQQIADQLCRINW